MTPSPDPPSVDQPQTFVAIARAHAEQRPNGRAFVFLEDGEDEERTLTYGELDRRARGLAVALSAHHAPGDRVLLAFPPGIDFITAFFGCLYGGFVAVPVVPPQSRQEHWVRFGAIATSSRTATVLSTAQLTKTWREVAAGQPALRTFRFLAVEEAAAAAAESWRDPGIEPAGLAFLQFTSGSTGLPKGVRVTHANLLHNETMIKAAFRTSPATVVVGWLPLFHDMGLIGGVLQPFYLGIAPILMSPVAFLQKPARWLRAISRYRATISGGPNFAYDLCVARVTPEQRTGLDLTSWAVAFNGAEPVRAGTMERFSRAFGGCGFRSDAFYPCYGLAEATLFVTGAPARRPPLVLDVSAKALEEGVVLAPRAGEETRPLVSSGRAHGGQRVAIVDPATGRECAAKTVGEVWVAGPSVADGYWERPEANGEAFGARLEGAPAATCLRTGDLGFLDEDGELFVTGRLKDLIIIRGRNHYPQDIEETVQRASPAFRAGCGAVFSVDVEGEERLVIVQEVDRSHATTFDGAAAIQAAIIAVAESHNIQTHRIVLIKHGTLPKTSSGKIERRTTRRLFLSGELATIAVEGADVDRPAAADPDFGRRLHRLAAAVLKLAPDRLDPKAPLAASGFDSLMAVELQQRIETELGASLPLELLLGGPTLATIAAAVAGAGARPISQVEAVGAGLKDGPLAPNQRALWVLSQLAPQSSAYNVALPMRLAAAIDSDRLRTATLRLVARHPVLRATFHVGSDGAPRQRYDAPDPAVFQCVAANGWSAEQLEREVAAAAARPFALTSGPVFRASLFQGQAQGDVLLLAAHHIAIDMWSLAQVVVELITGYEELQRGGELSTTPSGTAYADYVAWVGAQITSPRGEEHWEHWRTVLDPEPEPLRLPTDRPRPALQTYTGGHVDFMLSPGTTKAVRSLAQAAGATLFSTLLSAYQVFLHRLAGTDDVCVGCPVSGRSRPEFEAVVGYLVNTMVIRGRIRPEATFHELLKETQAAVAKGMNHGDFPFGTLVERLAPTRDPAQSPLFQTIFTLKRIARVDGAAAFAAGAAAGTVTLGSMKLSTFPLPCLGAQVDMALSIVDVDGSLHGRLEFNPDLFDRARIERMAGHFETLVAALVLAPERPLAKAEILSPAELRLILEDWGSAREAGPVAPLHELFEAHVAAHPEAEAVVTAEGVLTYSELNVRANRIAHGLLADGVKANQPVAIMADSAALQVSAMLGTLKAGAAFVCLDANYPVLRLRQILMEAMPPALIAETACLDRHADTIRALVTQLGCRVHAMDGESRDKYDPQVPGRSYRPDWDAVSPTDNPGRRHVPSHAAYVVFTSGSTGTPKGILQSHRSMGQFLTWQSAAFAMQAPHRIANWSALVYDASYCEIFGALCSGATVCMADPSVRFDPDRLVAWIRAERITLLQTVPSFLQQVLSAAERAGAGGSNPFPSLERVLVAGEELAGGLASAWIQRFGPRPALFNLYGPTEAVLATMHPVHEALPGRPVPIGKAFAGRQMLILDGLGRPCPIGVWGELYIRSTFLSMGYFRRPGETAEAFLPNPLTGDAADPVFRTRDLGRWRPDGTIEFGGRIDGQVKVRGMRVETAEVEAQIARHAAVKEAAVVAHAAGGQGLRLVAYVAATPQLSLAELREYLMANLPEHMLPGALVPCEALPRTRTGKIDRHALPPPDFTVAEGTAPATPVERQLAAIWQEILGVPTAFANTNFFAVGGHSLMATQVVNRIRETFGIDFSLKTFFAQPTLAEQARSIEAVSAAGGQDRLKHVMAELATLSDDEVRRLLESYKNKQGDAKGDKR